MPNHLDLGVDLLKKPFVIENGEIEIPEGDGLGIEIDEDLLQKHLYDGNWKNPTIILADGSLADW